MAPLKYEDKMREKLEKRMIQPSTNAWDKLSVRLDTSEEKKSKKGVFWFVGIAASIIGILWISSTLFSSKEFTPVESQIVDTPKIEVIEEKQQDIIVESPKELIADVQNKPQNPTESTVVKAIAKQNTPVITKEDVLIEHTIVEVVDKKEVENNTDLISLDAIKEENIETVVAQIIELKEENKEITDAEIDELLNKAQDKIRLKKLYKNNSQAIDAIALLQDVEADLDRSFRKKVFEALKINYNNVKTAVAQRND